MTSGDPLKRFPALDWPAEWVRDDKFWREVATRTIAGALTLIILGVPSVLYLGLVGQLAAGTVFAILIGVGMLVLFIALWWVLRFVVRAAGAKQARRVIRQDPRVIAASLTVADVDTAIQRFLRRRREIGDPFGEDFEASLRTEGSVYDVMTDTTRSRLERLRATLQFALAMMAVVLSIAFTAISIFFIR